MHTPPADKKGMNYYLCFSFHFQKFVFISNSRKRQFTVDVVLKRGDLNLNDFKLLKMLDSRPHGVWAAAGESLAIPAFPTRCVCWLGPGLRLTSPLASLCIMSVYEQLETAAIQAQRWNNIAVGVTAGLKSPKNTCDASTKVKVNRCGKWKRNSSWAHYSLNRQTTLIHYDLKKDFSRKPHGSSC